MMTDIFASFDPFVATGPKHSHIIAFILPCILCTTIPLIKKTISPTRLTLMLHLKKIFIVNQLNQSFTPKLKGLTSVLTILFLTLIYLNLSGLIPYMFSVTSHLTFTLTMGLPLWFSMIISSAHHSPSVWAASLLPGGGPSWLNPPLVLIESSSTLVRPLTLSFRLAANMTAGHIMLSLSSMNLASSLFLLSLLILMIMISIQSGYTLFEIGICLIQAFIFCLLLSLYTNDHAK